METSSRQQHCNSSSSSSSIEAEYSLKLKIDIKIYKDLRKTIFREAETVTKIVYNNNRRALYNEHFTLFQTKIQLYKKNLNVEFIYVDNVAVMLNIHTTISEEFDQLFDHSELNGIKKVERCYIYRNGIRSSIERHTKLATAEYLNYEKNAERDLTDEYYITFEWEKIEKKEKKENDNYTEFDKFVTETFNQYEFKKRLQTNDVLKVYVQSYGCENDTPTLKLMKMNRKFLDMRPPSSPVYISKKIDGQRFDGTIKFDYAYVNNIQITLNVTVLQEFYCHFEYMESLNQYILIDIFKYVTNDCEILFNHIEAIELMNTLFKNLAPLKTGDGAAKISVNEYVKTYKDIKSIKKINFKTDGILEFYNDGIFKKKRVNTIDLLYRYAKQNKEPVYNFYFQDSVEFSTVFPEWKIDLSNANLKKPQKKNFQHIVIEFVVDKTKKILLFKTFRYKSTPNTVTCMKNMIL